MHFVFLPRHLLQATADLLRTSGGACRLRGWALDLVGCIVLGGPPIVLPENSDRMTPMPER